MLDVIFDCVVLDGWSLVFYYIFLVISCKGFIVVAAVFVVIFTVVLVVLALMVLVAVMKVTFNAQNTR